MGETKIQYNGMGFGGVLTLIFVTLKLCGVINWSWWWVWCPMWIPFALFIALAIIFGIITIIVSLLK